MTLIRPTNYDAPDPNKRVFVYFNLHRKLFSIRQSNLIKGHAKQLFLHDVRYLVQPAGRAKVLKEQKKNVHAGLSGYLVERVPNVPDICFNVTYDPYKYETFVDCMYQKPIGWSEYAVLECGDGWRNLEAIFNHSKDVKKKRQYLKNVKVCA